MSNTVHLTPTMAPILSRLASREAPFLRRNAQGVLVQAWLKLDIALRHVDLTFTSKPASVDQEPVMDHIRGVLYLPLAAEMTGYLADVLLTGERVQGLIGYLLMTSYHSPDTGILVEEPSAFAGSIAKLIGMFDDHAGFEQVINVEELTLIDLEVKGLDSERNNRRTPERVQLVHDKLLGVDLVEDVDVDRAIAARIKKASGQGICLLGLRKRMKQLQAIAHGGPKLGLVPALARDVSVVDHTEAETTAVAVSPAAFQNETPGVKEKTAGATQKSAPGAPAETGSALRSGPTCMAAAVSPSGCRAPATLEMFPAAVVSASQSATPGKAIRLGTAIIDTQLAYQIRATGFKEADSSPGGRSSPADTARHHVKWTLIPGGLNTLSMMFDEAGLPYTASAANTAGMRRLTRRIPGACEQVEPETPEGAYQQAFERRNTWGRYQGSPYPAFSALDMAWEAGMDDASGHFTLSDASQAKQSSPAKNARAKARRGAKEEQLALF